MRVFYDHQVTSLQDAGGISRYFFELVRALAETGEVEAELLLGLNQSVLPFAELQARVTSYASPIAAGKARYALNEMLTSAMGPLRGRFDLYHAGYQRILPAIKKSAVVVTHHDSTVDRFPELFRDAKSIHARWARVFARADVIVCISEASRADLLRYYDVAIERTVVVHHGLTALPAARPGEGAGLLPEKPYLLWVGARHAYKNFGLMLQAFSLLCTDEGAGELQLMVAGGGEFTVAELSEVGRLKLTGQVHLLARPTDEQLAAAYRGAVVFVYPSLYEGFGFPPLEAMAEGCAAVVSRIAALEEVCGDAAFYFNPASVDELVDLLRRLLGDEALRGSKCEAGLAQVKRYTWEKAAQATLAAYRLALS